jgi:hypothetical protein
VTLRTGLACLTMLCALAGCGDGDPEPEGAPSPATTSTGAAATTSTEAAATTAPDTPASSADTFLTPSGNITCAYLAEASVLRCDIRSGLTPPPSDACQLDWTGLVIGANGPAEPQCAGDAVPVDDAVVLGYGETWRRDGLECLSGETGLECSNEDGGSFFLSRESWRAD